MFQRKDILEGAHVLSPSFEGVQFGPEFGEVEIRTNSYGLRDHREYASKRDDVVRILALGDSFTFGWGLPYEQTYLRRLELLLNDGEARERVEIAKAGIPAYGTRDELNYLKHYGLALKPDLVLLGFIGEDMINNGRSQFPVEVSRSLWRLVMARSFGELEARLRDGSHLYNLLIPMADQGALLRWFVQRKAADSFVLRSYPPKWDALWEATEGLLAEFHRTLEREGVSLVIVVIPQRIQILIRQLDMEGQQFEAGKPAELVKAFGARHDIPVIDPMARFLEASREGELFFPLDGHPNAAGARVLAEELNRVFRQVPRLRQLLDRDRRTGPAGQVPLKAPGDSDRSNIRGATIATEPETAAMVNHSTNSPRPAQPDGEGHSTPPSCHGHRRSQSCSSWKAALQDAIR